MNTMIKNSNTLLRKLLLTAFAILAITVAALSSGTTDAQAGGWKKFKKFHHYNPGYHYNYKYYRGCKRHYHYCGYKYHGGYKFKFKRKFRGGFKRKFRR